MPRTSSVLPAFNSAMLALLTALLGLLTIASSGASAQTLNVLHTFAELGNSDGGVPSAVAFDAAGNLYGASFEGGVNALGNVVRLSPPANPGDPWTESILYEFTGGTDGSYPNNIAVDKAGNLYGTTSSGGGSGNCGTAFKLKPPATSGRAWTFRTMYRFKGGSSDGCSPGSSLLDWKGNLYGPTTQGGASGVGTIWKIQPAGSSWTESVLYSFGPTPDLNTVSQQLTFDSAGNLYGVSGNRDGQTADGVFELSPPAVAGNPWTESVLHRFEIDSGGKGAVGPLVIAKNGSIFGVTAMGGTRECGIFYRLSKTKGQWTSSVLYRFAGTPDGQIPIGGVLYKPSTGKFYGVTYMGGAPNGGIAYEISPPAVAGSGWTEKVAYDFLGDTGNPASGLVSDPGGALYGTSAFGDFSNSGTLFQLIL